MHTNYVAMDNMSQEYGGNGGYIINISSVAGIDCSQFSTPIYNATKHAVTAFTRTLGVSNFAIFIANNNLTFLISIFNTKSKYLQDEYHYQRSGIKFITICPGVTLTNFLDNLDEKCLSPEAYECSSDKLQNVRKQT